MLEPEDEVAVDADEVANQRFSSAAGDSGVASVVDAAGMPSASASSSAPAVAAVPAAAAAAAAAASSSASSSSAVPLSSRATGVNPLVLPAAVADEAQHVGSPNLAHPSTPTRRGPGGAGATPLSPPGSPMVDMPMSPTVPYTGLEALVDKYLRTLQSAVLAQETAEAAALYEGEFHRLTRRYFDQTGWPHPECVLLRRITADDPMFEMLYRELYYRHFYSKLSSALTLHLRMESWRSYCDLFEEILDADRLDWDIPNQWIWDIIDEYVYQYQEFCQFRARMAYLSAQDVDALREDEASGSGMWSTTVVLRTLERLRDTSGVLAILERERRSGEPLEAELWESGPLHVKRMLGYYSMIALLRTHVMLGDYHSALRSLDPVDLSNKRGLYTKLSVCYVTTYYYLAFSYMMLKRYVDASKRLCDVLSFFLRTKQMTNRSPQFDNLNKKYEQLYGLLAMTLSLHPMRVSDESLNNGLRERHGEQLPRLQKGDEDVYEAVFHGAAPKFVSAVPPSLDAEPRENRHLEPRRRQLKLFKEEVQLQVQLQELRSYLKLYTSIPVAKISSFLGVTEDVFRTLVLRLKHRTRQLVWNGEGSVLDGTWQTHCDVDFYVDKDMIYISDIKYARRHGEFFVRNIVKFESLLANLKNKEA